MATRPTGNFEDKIRSLRERLERKYGDVFGRGRHRMTFANDKYVVKVPHNEEGVEANRREHMLYNTAGPRVKLRYAKCKLIEIDGLPIVIMERVRRAFDISYIAPPREAELPKKRPKWVDAVDCQQVGYNRKGKLVAYDYGG